MRYNWYPFTLLIIDVQYDMLETAVDFPDITENLKKLLLFARRRQMHIIHIRSLFEQDMSDWLNWSKLRKTSPLIRGTPGSGIPPFASEIPGEEVLMKHSFDAFLNTNLLNKLKKHQTQAVLVAGLETSICVLTTALAAFQRNYFTCLVTDCCADDRVAHRNTLDTYKDLIDMHTIDSLLDYNRTIQERITHLKKISGAYK